MRSTTYPSAYCPTPGGDCLRPCLPVQQARGAGKKLLPRLMMLCLALCLVLSQALLPSEAQAAHSENCEPSDSAPIVITDDTGATVTFAQPVKRVIALYGAFNEIFLALGAGDLLVARTAADGNLPELAVLPAIGTHMRPNAELVLAQQPDVVLQLEGRSEAQTQTENLRSLGLKVLTFEVNSFERLFEVTETLGRLAGREDKAQVLVNGWKGRVQALRSRNAGKPVIPICWLPDAVASAARYWPLPGAKMW